MRATVDDVFGARLLAARRAAGLSQEAIVERVERVGVRLHVTAIGKIERGERRVTVGEAAALATCFGMTLDELIGAGGPLVSPRAIVREARLEFQRSIGAYYRALSEYARAVEDQTLDQSEDDRLIWEAKAITPARLIAFGYIDRLSNDFATREISALPGGFPFNLARSDSDDRMAVIDAAGGIDAVSEIVDRDDG